MASDREGKEYWFAIDSGVLKYDGYLWTQYGSKQGLIGDKVSTVYVDESETVFAATSYGVFQLINEQWETMIEFKANPGFTITSIYRLESGSVLCSSNKGVLLLTDEKDILLTTKTKWQGIKDLVNVHFVEIPEVLLAHGEFDYFSDVYEPEPGKLWMAVTFLLKESGDVLVMFEDDLIKGEVNHYSLLSDLLDADLGHEQLFHKAINGDVWIVNKGNKKPALQFTGQGWKKKYYGDQFGDDEYSESIAQTADGRMWIGGIGNLYSYEHSGKWTKYQSEVSNIPQAHVEVYAVGNQLWVYGHQSAVFKIDLSDEVWLTYKGLNFEGVDRSGIQWFLGLKGQVVFNQSGKWLEYNRAHGVISHPVRLFIDSNDVPWVLGSDEGVAAVCYLYQGKWQKHHFKTLSWSLDYRDIWEAGDGSIWLGGCTDVFMEKGQTGGLVRMTGSYESPIIQIHPSRANGLNQQNVYGIAESDGKLWIGGTTLNYFDGDSWQTTSHSDLQDFVNVVHADSSGTLYVGSRQHGLYIRSVTGQWTRFSMENGLASNNIISISTDANGEKVWLATDRDISLHQNGHWINNVFPDAHTMSYEGGRMILDVNGGLWVNHAPRSWKRRVYNERLPGEKAQASFAAYRYLPQDNPPETKVDLYNPEVDNAGNTAIFWSGHHYFNRVSPEDLLYSFRLNEGEWSGFSNQTTHTFTGLADGHYVFEVRSMDPQGNIDPTPARIEFSVIPPVWKQMWFLSLILVFVVLLSILQFQILRKRKVLKHLNESLQRTNAELESRNQEVEDQKESLEKAVQKIDQLSRAKVNFFTNITHEFRTPLSLIIGPIEKLSEGPNDIIMTNKLHAIIRNNAIRLQKLINQLLEIRRIESGTLELSLEQGDMVSFIRDIKALFENKAREKEIKFQFRTDFERLTLLFDKDKVEKILFNLLSNAFKHTSSGESIFVSLQNGADGFVQLVVADSGCGMTGHELQTLFERYTTDGRHEAYTESSGIGLSYIKDLVECHHGEITVESQEDVGTVFTVCLPDKLEARAGLPATSFTYSIGESLETSILPVFKESSLSVNKTDKERILIVEDNDDMRHFLSMVVNQYYEVITASDGVSAMEVLHEQDVHLVISDVMMPDMNGRELCKAIKGTKATSHIPVILLTAMSRNEAVISGYESGADSYLTKPFSPELLLVRIRNLKETREKLKAQYTQGLHFQTNEVKLTSMDETFLSTLTELIKNHASDSQFDVTKMCEMTSLSHMHFIRKVKHLTGKKPVELLKSYRLRQAQLLLSQKKINVSQVGYMVGYDVPNSFARAFRQEFGLSPSEYVLSLENTEPNRGDR